MATYPGPNDGLSPLDPATEVGQFRALLGDTQATPYEPPVTGRGNYEMFSDLELEGFLAAAGSLNRAMGNAYLALAGRAATESRSIKDFDLSIDTTKRAADLRLVALQWLTMADREDAAQQDAFFIADLGASESQVPEAMLPQWGRYVVGEWKC